MRIRNTALDWAVGGDCMNIGHCRNTLRRNFILESIQFLFFCKKGCWLVSFHYYDLGTRKVKACPILDFLFTYFFWEYENKFRLTSRIFISYHFLRMQILLDVRVYENFFDIERRDFHCQNCVQKNRIKLEGEVYG